MVAFPFYEVSDWTAAEETYKQAISEKCVSKVGVSAPAPKIDLRALMLGGEPEMVFDDNSMFDLGGEHALDPTDEDNIKKRKSELATQMDEMAKQLFADAKDKCEETEPAAGGQAQEG